MSLATDMLLTNRGLIKLYEQSLTQIRTAWQLSQLEITIISFLHNNPGRDTIGDISEIRMIPKGNVSQGVESLVQKSYVVRTPDPKDRRKVHLSLTDRTQAIVSEIEETQKNYGAWIFEGFTEEELRLFQQMNEKILERVNEKLERK